MKKYTLTNTLEFAIEAEKSKVRLIVLESGEELVCRKERVNELHRFIELDSGTIFKGRLQLQKQKDDILISVKGGIAGSIPANDFKKLLDEVKPYESKKKK